MKSTLTYVFSFFAWSVFLVGAALSQSAVPSATQAATTISVLPFYQIAEPYLLSAFGIIFATLLTWLIAQLQARTSIKIGDSARAQVQQAAVNAAGRILAAQEGSLASVKIDVKSPLVAEEAAKVAALVPDALAKIGVTPEKAGDALSNLIAGKVGVLQATASSAPAPVNVSVVPPAGTSVTTTAG